MTISRVFFSLILVAVLLLAIVLAERSDADLDSPRKVASTSATTDRVELIPPLVLEKPSTTIAPKVKTKPRPRTGRVTLGDAGQVNGYACGGDLPDCWVLRHEGAGGVPDPTVWNGGCHHPAGFAGDNPCGSSASGLWQFLRSTWANFGGFLNAADAPVSVQNDKARIVWNHGRGCAAWSAC